MYLRRASRPSDTPSLCSILSINLSYCLQLQFHLIVTCSLLRENQPSPRDFLRKPQVVTDAFFTRIYYIL